MGLLLVAVVYLYSPSSASCFGGMSMGDVSIPVWYLGERPMARETGGLETKALHSHISFLQMHSYSFSIKVTIIIRGQNQTISF
jgi:hypothetical protein